MNPGGASLLVVDDEPSVRRLLRTTLAGHGYRILEAGSGQAALDMLAREPPDVVLLDLGLPDRDGREVIRRLRESGSGVPIIVLSSRDGEAEKVEALDLGADDYVTKPFGMAELVARIRAVLRRQVPGQGAEPVFRIGDLTVDLARGLVQVGGREVRLTNKEWDILRLLVMHAGTVLTHRAIMQAIWRAKGDVQYLRIYVRSLRRKLEPNPEQPRYILTETGIGYRLRADD
jgi:two-component system, OmpR family, KDP operon response regulator KdpE